MKKGTLLHESKGVTWVMKVGTTGMTPVKLAENVVNAANNAILKHVAGAWDNVRALHVKAENSIALPVYQHVSDKAIEGEKRREREEEEEEERE